MPRLGAHTARTWLAVALVAAVIAVVASAPLSAAPPAQAGSCGSQTPVQPFAPWGDDDSYVIDPGGTFENGCTPWQLQGGAQVVAGNESYYVNSPTDSHSLAIPSGASALSAPLTATLLDPTLRFFARNTGSPLGALLVEAEVDGVSVPVATVVGGPAWSPTLPYPFLLNTLALLNGGQVSVSFRFIALGGDWQIDDVYVDPYESR